MNVVAQRSARHHRRASYLGQGNPGNLFALPCIVVCSYAYYSMHLFLSCSSILFMESGSSPNVSTHLNLPVRFIPSSFPTQLFEWDGVYYMRNSSSSLYFSVFDWSRLVIRGAEPLSHITVSSPKLCDASSVQFNPPAVSILISAR